MKNYLETVTEDIGRYLRKYSRTEALAWINVVRYYGIILPIILVAIVVMVINSSPFPPKVAYLAVGQTGSSYVGMAKRFHDIFARDGIDLVLVDTEGLGEGLQKLNDDTSAVNASFYTAGSVDATNYPNLVSLGAIQFAPIWIFYRGDEVKTNDPFEYFTDKRFAVGLKGTVTNRLFNQLYQLNQKAAGKTPDFIELTHQEAAEQLIAGKLDAMFYVDNFQSPTVQRLLSDKNIKIMSFNLAEAYARKLPFIESLRIPMGSIDIESVSPPADVRIIASTTNLLIEKSMHPAIQWAFIKAAREINGDRALFFSNQGFFPRQMDVAFPLSPVAKRFYNQGMPQVFDYVPLWLGSIIDNVWVLVLGLIAIVYPLLKAIAGFRTYPSKKAMYDLFYDLRDIDERAIGAQTRDELEALEQKLKYYDALNVSTWLSPTEVRFYFTLKTQINNIRKDIRAKLDMLA